MNKKIAVALGCLFVVVVGAVSVRGVAHAPVWRVQEGGYQIAQQPDLTGVVVGEATPIPAGFVPYAEGCNQSATTADCTALAKLPQTPPEPHSSDLMQPVADWVSATNTPITFHGFTFLLPPGWRGTIYDEYGQHNLTLQRGAETPIFHIACPPPGKGLEAATRLSFEERSFVRDGLKYIVTLETWSAAHNNPWRYIRIHTSDDAPVCIVSGSMEQYVFEAMNQMYQTIE